MISISKPKLLAISLILIIASGSFYLGHVLATPAPSVGRVVTPGDLGPCDYFVYMDGTTPVALFESHTGGTPGDNKVGTAGQDVGAFLNSITAPSISYCLGTSPFLFSTAWTLQTGDQVNGNFNSSAIKANANNIDLINIPGAATGSTFAQDIVIQGLLLDTNGHTGVNGINFNMSSDEISAHNQISEIKFKGTFNYLMIMDGNEDTHISDIYQQYSPCAVGDISLKVAQGSIYTDHIVYGCTSGTSSAIHVIGNVFILDSVFDRLIFETQCYAGFPGGVCSQLHVSLQVIIERTFMANLNGPDRMSVAPGQTMVVQQLSLIDSYLCTGNGGALFAAKTGSLTISRLDVINSYICQISGSMLWHTTNTNVGSSTINQIHWMGNYVNGVISDGDYSSTGFGTFYFHLQSGSHQLEPAGFTQAAPGVSNGSPGLPAGTGSANKVVNRWPWPVTVYMNVTSAANVRLQTGMHILDTADNGGTDKAVLGNPEQVTLYPSQYIYFVTNLPYAWQWYGQAW